MGKLRLEAGWASPEQKKVPGLKQEMEGQPGRGGAAEPVWQEPGHQGLIWGNTLTLGDFGTYAGHIPGKTGEMLQRPACPVCV